MDLTRIEIDPNLASDFTLQVASGLVVAAILGLLAWAFRRRPGDKKTRRRTPEPPPPPMLPLPAPAPEERTHKVEQAFGDVVAKAYGAARAESIRYSTHMFDAIPYGVAAGPDSEEGQMRFNEKKNCMEAFVGGSWKSIDAQRDEYVDAEGTVTMRVQNLTNQNLVLPGSFGEVLAPRQTRDFDATLQIWNDDSRIEEMRNRGFIRYEPIRRGEKPILARPASEELTAAERRLWADAGKPQRSALERPEPTPMPDANRPMPIGIRLVKG